jgi:hypothetical protein
MSEYPLISILYRPDLDQPCPVFLSYCPERWPRLIGQKFCGYKCSLADAGYPGRRLPPFYGGRRATRWVTDDCSCSCPDVRQVAKGVLNAGECYRRFLLPMLLLPLRTAPAVSGETRLSIIPCPALRSHLFIVLIPFLHFLKPAISGSKIFRATLLNHHSILNNN